MPGDDKLAKEEAAARETRAPSAAAGGSSLDRALGDEGDTAMLRPAQMVEEVGSVVCSLANRGGGRERSREGQGGVEAEEAKR
jgi:hypothetical protein